MNKDSTPGFIQVVRKQIRLVALLALVALAPLALSCFGSFPLTRTIYHANRDVYHSVPGDSTQRKLAQSAVMWLFTPVYFVAGIGDMVVCNLIEFWTGNKVMETGYNDSVNGTRVELASQQQGREAVLTIWQHGKIVQQQHFIRTAPGACEVRDGQGRLLGTVVKNARGGLTMNDAGGKPMQTLSAAELGALKKS